MCVLGEEEHVRLEHYSSPIVHESRASNVGIQTHSVKHLLHRPKLAYQFQWLISIFYNNRLQREVAGNKLHCLRGLIGVTKTQPVRSPVLSTVR